MLYAEAMRLAVVTVVGFGAVSTVAAEPPAPPPPAMPLPPVTFTLGGGVAWTGARSLHFNDDGITFVAGASARFDLELRLHPNVAVGIHAGFARSNAYVHFFEQGLNDVDYTANELGLTVQLAFDHVWIAPWVGRSKLDGDVSEDAHPTLGGGLTVGVPVLQVGNLAFDVFAAASGSMKDNSDGYLAGEPVHEPFYQFTVGVDARFIGSLFL